MRRADMILGAVEALVLFFVLGLVVVTSYFP